MTSSIKEFFDQQRYQDAWLALFEEAKGVHDYDTYLGLCRWRKKLKKLSVAPEFSKAIKVAILGGATTDFLKQPLALAIEELGMGCDIFCAAYNTFAKEMLDSESETVKFRPDVAILLINSSNMPRWPSPGDSLEQVNRLATEMCDHWLHLSASLHQMCQCEVIVNNFHMFPLSPMGNMTPKVPWDKNIFLRKVNLELGEKAQKYVHIHDVDSFASSLGIVNYFDERFWYQAKQPMSFKCMIPYVKNLGKIIGAIYGMTAKCLVLDLDNTLWGGVVGDDGSEGIVIGDGDPLGEAFLAFQEYILQLKNRGILLAVCSKNEEVNAKAPFVDRPEMLLKQEDFVAFKANWKPKSQNIVEIAQELNIGADSMVFVDDNPAERELVRQQLPQVRVVELTEDPSDYSQILNQTGWFEIVSLSAEDALRTVQYQDNLKRQALLKSNTDYSSYLASLQQKAVIAPFEEKYLDRITQLINKTNQFNLTTHRMSRSEVEGFMGKNDTFHVYVKLIDCFGDNGLISILIGHIERSSLILDNWLMSCRVLKRGVEQLLSNYIVQESKKMGITQVKGLYIPTAKNGLVREHYKMLGYTCVAQTELGETHWELRIEDYRSFPVQIQLKG